MDIHAYLRSNLGKAISKRCKKEGCHLKLDSLSSYQVTVIDADKYKDIRNHEGRLCDYFIFLTRTDILVVVLEMKSGHVDVRVTAEQLQSGAIEATQLLSSCNSKVTFYPVLVHGKGFSSLAYRALQKLTVQFCGSNHHIITVKCGASLRNVLDI